jgi:hypothetical protein
LLQDARSRRALGVLERFADGGADKGELTPAYDAAWAAARAVKAKGVGRPEWAWCRWLARSDAAEAVARSLGRAALPAATRAARHMRGAIYWAALSAAHKANPKVQFRDTIDVGNQALAEGHRLACELLRCVFGNPFRPVAIEPSCLTPAVLRLARAAYDDRPDPARLGRLAAALEAAGCMDAGLLGHLRSPGPHVLGCSAVDALL